MTLAACKTTTNFDSPPSIKYLENREKSFKILQTSEEMVPRRRFETDLGEKYGFANVFPVCCLMPLGRFWNAFWRTLDFEGVPKSTFLAYN